MVYNMQPAFRLSKYPSNEGEGFYTPQKPEPLIKTDEQLAAAKAGKEARATAKAAKDTYNDKRAYVSEEAAKRPIDFGSMLEEDQERWLKKQGKQSDYEQEEGSRTENFPKVKTGGYKSTLKTDRAPVTGLDAANMDRILDPAGKFHGIAASQIKQTLGRGVPDWRIDDMAADVMSDFHEATTRPEGSPGAFRIKPEAGGNPESQVMQFIKNAAEHDAKDYKASLASKVQPLDETAVNDKGEEESRPATPAEKANFAKPLNPTPQVARVGEGNYLPRSMANMLKGGSPVDKFILESASDMESHGNSNYEPHFGLSETQMADLGKRVGLSADEVRKSIAKSTGHGKTIPVPQILPKAAETPAVGFGKISTEQPLSHAQSAQSGQGLIPVKGMPTTEPIPTQGFAPMRRVAIGPETEAQAAEVIPSKPRPELTHAPSRIGGAGKHLGTSALPPSEPLGAGQTLPLIGDMPVGKPSPSGKGSGKLGPNLRAAGEQQAFPHVVNDAETDVRVAQDRLDKAKAGSAAETLAKADLKEATARLKEAKSKGASPIRRIAEDYLQRTLQGETVPAPDLIPNK
jgi:hypothetical protein